MILHSSLCEKVDFSVPTSWEQMTQEQLRYVIRLLWLYGETPDWQERVRTAAFLHFCGIEVARRTDQGWLCRVQKTGQTFLLDHQLLPSLLQHLDWICHTELMTVRIEQVGRYKAVDFELRELMFGNYLMAENFYQAFLLGKDRKNLLPLAEILYAVPDGGDTTAFAEDILTGVFLWFCAAKQLLGQWFPNFLKTAGEDTPSVTRESLHESTQAQIRLLTKGDVTKQKYILEQTDTWTALAELDALAKEAEELKR